MLHCKPAVYVAVLCSLCLGLVAGPPTALAQRGGSQKIATGQAVTWGTEWTHEPDISTGGGDFELLVLSRGPALAAVGGTGFPAPAADVRAVAIDAFASVGDMQQIDRGSYDNVSYSLDISTAESGARTAVFILVIEREASTGVSVLIAPPLNFEAAMVAVQRGVQVDGDAIFAGVDAAVMQQFVDESSGGHGESADLPATDAVELPSPTPGSAEPTQAGDDSLVGGLNAGLGRATATLPADRVPRSDSDASLTNSTVIASSGVPLTYSNDWIVDEKTGDSIHLVAVGDVLMFASAIDVGPQSGQMDATELAKRLAADHGLEGVAVVEAIDAGNGRKLVVLVDRDPTGDIYLIYDITLDASSTTAFLLTVFESDIDAGVALVTSTIRVQGEPVLEDLGKLVPSVLPADS